MTNYQRIDQFDIPPNFRGRSVFIVQLWWLVQASLFAWSPQFLYSWRCFLLRLFGAKIGNNVRIRPTAKILYPWKVKLDDYCVIGDDVELYSMANITVGSNCVISQRSYLCTGSHNYTRVTFDLYSSPIRLEEQVWVASDVFIGPGVTVGRGAVIGVRSTVLKNMPAGMVCYGSPAKPIRKRDVVIE